MPFQALAKLDAEGSLAFRAKVCRTRVLDMKDDPGGDKSKRSPVRVVEIVSYRYKRNEFEVYDTKGNKIDSVRLVKLLRKECLVVIASDGKNVDPLYLRILAPEVVVIVIPTATFNVLHTLPFEEPIFPKD
jgi:hypothetical protein